MIPFIEGQANPVEKNAVIKDELKPNTTMTLKITGTKFVVDAVNSEHDDSLHLEATITPNRFGGAGVFWPGGSANTYSKIEISYPGR